MLSTLYGAGSSYFLSLYAAELGYPAARKELLRHAAGEEGSPARALARREYLDMLRDLGELRELRTWYRQYVSEDDVRYTAYVLMYGMALHDSGRFRELSRLLEENLALREAPLPDDENIIFSFLRLSSLFKRGKDGWSPILLRLAADTRSEDLPGELFDSSGKGQTARLWETVETGEVFRQGEKSLLLGKKAYRSDRYIDAYRYYSDFLMECMEETDLYTYCTGEMMDEYALSALYSGNVTGAVELSETLFASIKEEGKVPLLLSERSRFWLLETLGYLKRKLGRFTEAVQHYSEALLTAPSSEEERIRWYIYDSLVRTSYAQAVADLPEQSSSWQDPAYYNDVLFDLIDGLVRYERWDLIAQTADTLMGTLTNTAVSRACYIAARAAEEGKLAADEEHVIAWLKGAIDNASGAGSGLYYRFMAASRLDLRGGQSGLNVLKPEDFCVQPKGVRNPRTGATRSWETADWNGMDIKREEDGLLRGFIRFGLSEEAYRRYGTDETRTGTLSPETVRSWCESLQANGHYLESIRLLNAYCLNSRRGLTVEDVKLLYPRAYRDLIGPLSLEYELPDYLLYALVREESLFDAEISSSAGAVGLSQLMPATARDVASRIGLETSKLTDPAVNLKLGAWYLAHLIDRTENYSQALFSYNGGITRLRRWVQSDVSLPGDLLLEKIPYAETSHYGRKVLVSSILYGYFYHGIDYRTIIGHFFDVQQK